MWLKKIYGIQSNSEDFWYYDLDASFKSARLLIQLLEYGKDERGDLLVNVV